MIKNKKRGNDPNDDWGKTLVRRIPQCFWLFFISLCRGKIQWLKSPSFMIVLCVSHVRDEGHLPPDLFFFFDYNTPPFFFFFLSICLIRVTQKGFFFCEEIKRGLAQHPPDWRKNTTGRVAWPVGRQWQEWKTSRLEHDTIITCLTVIWIAQPASARRPYDHKISGLTLEPGRNVRWSIEIVYLPLCNDPLMRTFLTGLTGQLLADQHEARSPSFDVQDNQDLSSPY